MVRVHPPRQSFFMNEFKKFQLRWAEWIGSADCLYMQRWVLVLFGYAIRLHHWVASDDPRHLHDHPWWMLIIVLKGGYTDISETKRDELKAGSVRFRPATHKHTVAVNGSCWSLLFTGPKVRNWGFWVPGRNTLLRPRRYFKRFGHHQCDL